MHLDVTPATAGALHQDAVAAVATQGPLGEAYLELDPGSPQAPLVKPGDTIRGKEPFRIDQVISRLGNLLNTAADSLGKNPESIPRLITSLGKLTDKLNQALDENPQALSQIVRELAGTVKELHALSADAHQALAPGGKGAALLADAAASAKTLRKELPGLTQDAHQTLKGLQALTGQLSPEDGKKLKQAIADYAEAGRHLERLAARADKLSAELDAGKGTVGGLLKDPKLYQDVKDLVEELKKHPWRLIWKD
jgi:phospholipid/cholesterol/gamma-HCH transport system substrate-binding protein